MQDRPLQNALESQRWLGLAVVIRRQQRRRLVKEVFQLLAQSIKIRATSTQDLKGCRVVRQRQQQVLHGQELMSLLAGFLESEVQRELEFFT